MGESATNENQAARPAPAFDGLRLTRALLPPCTSFRSGGVRPRRRRPVREVSRTKRRSWNPRRRPRSLRSRRGDRRRSARRGPRCAHRLPRTPQPPPERTRRVGVARRQKPPASARAPKVALGGAARPLAARNRGLASTDRGGEPAGQEHAARPAPLCCTPRVVPLRSDASTDGAATFQLVPASTAPRRPFRRLRAPGTPARKPYASRSPFRSFVAPLRTRAAARCARLAPGLAPGANQSPRCARLNSPCGLRAR